MLSTAKKSILLIDDDKQVLTTLTRLLKKSGHVVCAFQDPREAVQEAMMEDFDLVITDIRMPHIDGFQAIRYIREVRKEKGQSDIPGIFITGYAEDYGKEKHLTKSHPFILKPFDLEEFMTVVNGILEKDAST